MAAEVSCLGAVAWGCPNDGCVAGAGVVALGDGLDLVLSDRGVYRKTRVRSDADGADVLPEVEDRVWEELQPLPAGESIRGDGVATLGLLGLDAVSFRRNAKRSDSDPRDARDPIPGL